ncbi:MAG: hypothetical protein ACFE7R_04195, partial [Candidatus Hodarchaeota archaeon]
MKRLPRTWWLIVVGLILITTGGFVPVRIPFWKQQNTFPIGPVDSSSESIDIRLNLLPGESAAVTVNFDDTAVLSDCLVWALVNYQYPTKSISETALRFEGEGDISFTFGWAHVRLIPIFVTGFVIRLFYLGYNQISVNTTVTRLGNLLTYSGLGIIVIS